ncbi:MAG: hypothetical protein E6R11_07980 [Rhodocyclaceae bacterium]|jgi:hypothetical protein|nr:MAG: hypothetical protein E6R11_07980 [Rhodocyclaceae bacterium]
MSYNTLKASETLCRGARAVSRMQCNGTLYKCVCGAVGCKQTCDDMCSNQGFDVKGRCCACGAFGKMEVVSR